MDERTYEVESIHCSGCERAIRATVGALDGVERVRPDARTNLVAVRFEPARVSDDTIRARLGEAGFPLADARSGHGGSDGGLARYVLLVVGVAAVALAGYLGYVVYPRFDRLALEGAAVLGLAAAAGVAAFFSPCSFPLLLTLLGRRPAVRAGGEGVAGSPARFGGALAVGAGAFLLLAGLVIAVGGGALFEQVTFASRAGIAIRTVVGLLLVGLGLVQVGAVPSPFHVVEHASRPLLRRQAKLRREHPVAGFAVFGFGYVLAGFG